MSRSSPDRAPDLRLLRLSAVFSAAAACMSTGLAVMWAVIGHHLLTVAWMTVSACAFGLCLLRDRMLIRERRMTDYWQDSAQWWQQIACEQERQR